MADESEKSEPDEAQTENDRREFLNKTLGIAGALAAGVVGGALAGCASADGRQAGPIETLKNSPLRYEKLAAPGSGHQFSVVGPEIGAVLAREGLIAQDVANNPNVGISILIGIRG